MQLLDELLPAHGARVLDVGGGTGAYARALATAGYQVRLLDLVPAHVAQARAGQPPIDADVADARELSEADDTYDVTLLLGPLYHLPDRQDRVAALSEAVRVTRPGGRVIAAAISRFAWPLECVAAGSSSDSWIEDAQSLVTDGTNDPERSFTYAYFHRLEELVDECQTAGLDEIVVYGVEGPAWTAAEAAAGSPTADAVFARALILAQIYSREPALIASSAHLLAAGTVAAGGRRSDRAGTVRGRIARRRQVGMSSSTHLSSKSTAAQPASATAPWASRRAPSLAEVPRCSQGGVWVTRSR